MRAWSQRFRRRYMRACGVMPLPVRTAPDFDTGASSGPGASPRTASQSAISALPPFVAKTRKCANA